MPIVHASLQTNAKSTKLYWKTTSSSQTFETQLLCFPLLQLLPYTRKARGMISLVRRSAGEQENAPSSTQSGAH